MNGMEQAKFKKLAIIMLASLIGRQLYLKLGFGVLTIIKDRLNKEDPGIKVAIIVKGEEDS